ncbi:unnamed protein product [Allacma fusca]|uniref:Uncharacterized protein n=1 Tax=Allacma fusca TaxID=39272 RepID=A0A8J2PWL3_9HEXA|nr:unnamed protein product [Allacma fusca]
MQLTRLDKPKYGGCQWYCAARLANVDASVHTNTIEGRWRLIRNSNWSTLKFAFNSGSHPITTHTLTPGRIPLAAPGSLCCEPATFGAAHSPFSGNGGRIRYTGSALTGGFLKFKMNENLRFSISMESKSESRYGNC